MGKINKTHSFDEEVIRQVGEMAKEENRNQSQMINLLVIEAIENRKSSGVEPTQ